MGLLGAVFVYGVKRGMRADNPVHGVTRFADQKRERRLSEAEYAALGAALNDATMENMWPPGLAAIRFLALTGWRSGEVLGLRWGEVDLARRTVILMDSSACQRGKSSARR
jgi:integrase